MLIVVRLVTLAAALLFSFGALAQAQVQDDDDEEEEAPPPATQRLPDEKLPLQELSEPVLYELLLAEIALQRGSAGLAAQAYADLARRTRDPRIARRAVEVATLARTPEFALQSALAWLEADPQSLQALRGITLLLVSLGRVEEAEPYIAKLLAHDGSAATSGFLQLGQLLGANPDKAANLRVVRKLAQRYPKLAEAHVAVAQAAMAANEEALALAELGQAAQLRPDWELPPMFEAQILHRKSPEAATKRLAEFLQKYPKSRDARLAYARLLVADGRYDEARREFDALLALHKDDTEAIYGVGLLAMQAKDYATAEANLKRLLELNYRDADGVRYTLGQVAEEQKDWPRAIGWYEKIERGEQALPARMRTAHALAKQGKLDEARAYLRSVSASESQRVQLVIAEAQLLREANRNSEAFELLGTALQNSPDQPDLLYDYALTAEKLERVDVLEANLRKLIQIKPDHAHAHNALGYSLADRNVRLPEAKKLIERALEIAPEDYYIIDSMGWVLYRMGDLKGAATQLQRAWRGRQDAEIGAHLGEVLWVMGERGAAERIWQEALKSGPENETLQKTIKRLKQ